MTSSQSQTKEGSRSCWPLPVIGLTGSIACGKTTIGKVFTSAGAEVIDADKLLRQVTRKGMPAYRQIVEIFGDGILDRKGRIDRPALAKLVFADRAKKRCLEAITHGEIMRAAARRIERIAARKFTVVFLEAALLVEAGLHKMLDGLVVVTCRPELQIERLRKHRGMSEAEARARIQAQLPSSRKAEVADWVIDNSGTLHEAALRARKILAEIRQSPIYRRKRRLWQK